jgi:PhoPQ-activated pathogenicity-related protein
MTSTPLGREWHPVSVYLTTNALAMKRQSHCWALIFILAWGFTHWITAQATPLDEYVAKGDTNYTYVHHDTRVGQGYTIFVVAMTSQNWRTHAEVDQVLWRHEVLIAVPWIAHSGNQHTAFLIVNGGSNGSNRPQSSTENDDLLGIVSVVTGSVSAMVSQIPNQPLRFFDETEPRIEDALLAYGMDKYLLTGDPEWLAHLPMTKAVVRAMDTVQSFSANSGSRWPKPPRIDDFIIAGGSKRGWTTWLTAAVEARKGEASRVKAILPASIDLLNLGEQFSHHWEAYGFYAPAVQDYVDFDLPCRSKTPEGQTMLTIIDPYEYRNRLTMPKLVLNSAGDQFFLPDSSRFYFADLQGPKQLRYTLNTDHSQGQDLPSIILPTLSWLSDVLDDKPSPQFSWSLDPDGSIRVQTGTKPERVRLWQATNPNARDFRLEAIGAAWTSSVLQDAGNGVYVGYVAPPAQGWTAFTVELTFPGSTAIPTPLESNQVFTTDVRVTPDTLPFKGTDCFCWACLPGWGGWRSILK